MKITGEVVLKNKSNDLKCDMCGKESVGKGGHVYVKDPFSERTEIGHLEGWIVLGPACLDLLRLITERNYLKEETPT